MTLPLRTGEAIELTILMPCLNEARTVAACVSEAWAFLKAAGVPGEVLVADNGSSDGSPALARAAGARVIDVPVRGYGAALMAGIRAAKGRFIVMGDADQSYDFSSLSSFLERLRDGADLVMGNRFQGGIHAGAMPPLHRYIGNPILSFIGRRFFRVPIGDFHCGLRGFRRDPIRELGLVTLGMEFASEMVAKAALVGLRIEEVPVVLRPDGRDRSPHLRTWRDGWRHLRFLLLFCPRWLFLYPGIGMIFSGLLGFLALLPGGLNFGRLGLGVHTLLYMAAAIVLGVQMIQLALLTKWMGVLSGIVPKPVWLSRMERFLSLEVALVMAGALVLGGGGWSITLVHQWSAAGFGSLDPVQSMRDVIPAVTMMILGAQAGASALFAAALKMCMCRPAPGAGHV